MSLKLFYALLLTVMPFTELRVGLPLAINYAAEQNIPVIYIFSLIVLLNVLVIFFIFYFLDNLHHLFMNFKIYRNNFEFFLKRFQRKVDRLEKRHESIGFIALVFFVSVPLPLTGAWSGCLASWILGLDRKKSILAISLGVLIAGIIILIGTLGTMKLFF